MDLELFMQDTPCKTRGEINGFRGNLGRGTGNPRACGTTSLKKKKRGSVSFRVRPWPSPHLLSDLVQSLIAEHVFSKGCCGHRGQNSSHSHCHMPSPLNGTPKAGAMLFPPFRGRNRLAERTCFPRVTQPEAGLESGPADFRAQASTTHLFAT